MLCEITILCSSTTGHKMSSEALSVLPRQHLCKYHLWTRLASKLVIWCHSVQLIFKVRGHKCTSSRRQTWWFPVYLLHRGHYAQWSSKIPQRRQYTKTSFKCKFTLLKTKWCNIQYHFARYFMYLCRRAIFCVHLTTRWCPIPTNHTKDTACVAFSFVL